MDEDNRRAQDLLNQLMAIQAALQSNLAREAREIGLSAAQARVAQDLADHPDSPLQEVCARLLWPKSTVSRLVDDLVRKDLATRAVPAENRRTVVLSLRQSLQDECLSGALRNFFPGSGGKLGPGECRELHAALDRLLLLLRPLGESLPE